MGARAGKKAKRGDFAKSGKKFYIREKYIMTDIKHGAQKIADEFYDLTVKEVYDGLKANPPGTVNTVKEQWIFVRPLLGLIVDKMADRMPMLALLDFIGTMDAELINNEIDKQQD